MSPALVLAAATALFASLPYAARGGLVFGTLLPVAITVLLAVAASGRPNGLAVMAGATAAFLGCLAWDFAPAAASVIVVGLAYGERTLRVRTLRAKGAHLGIALVAGACSGALAASFSDAPWVDHAVATLLAAVLVTAPLVVVADDPRVVALESAAATLGAPVAATILEAVELRRRADVLPLDRETAAGVKKSWASLDRLVEARLRMHRARGSSGDTAALVTAMVDRQITEHVASLWRAGAAATTIGAAEAGFDDRAVRDVHARGEALDEQSRAIVEVGLR